MVRFFAVLLLSSTALFSYSPGTGAFKKYQAGQYGVAIRIYRAALAEAVKTANQVKEVIYLNNIATAFNALGKADSARAYLDRAEKSCLGEAGLLFMVRVNGALLSSDASVSVSESELSAARAVLSGYEYGALLNACGRILLTRNEPDKALPLFKQTLDLYEKSKASVGFAEASFFIAKSTLASGNAEKALKLADEALALYQQGGWYPGIKRCLGLKEEIYVKLGDSAAAERVRALKSRLP